jgi:hypothetical protein
MLELPSSLSLLFIYHSLAECYFVEGERERGEKKSGEKEVSALFKESKRELFEPKQLNGAAKSLSSHQDEAKRAALKESEREIHKSNRFVSFEKEERR